MLAFTKYAFDAIILSYDYQAEIHGTIFIFYIKIYVSQMRVPLAPCRKL